MMGLLDLNSRTPQRFKYAQHLFTILLQHKHKQLNSLLYVLAPALRLDTSLDAQVQDTTRDRHARSQRAYLLSVCCQLSARTQALDWCGVAALRAEVTTGYIVL